MIEHGETAQIPIEAMAPADGCRASEAREPGHMLAGQQVRGIEDADTPGAVAQALGRLLRHQPPLTVRWGRL